MNNDCVHSLALLKLESDGTTLTLQNAEPGICHGCKKVLPGEAAGGILTVLWVHGFEDGNVVAFDSDLDWFWL